MHEKLWGHEKERGLVVGLTEAPLPAKSQNNQLLLPCYEHTVSKDLSETQLTGRVVA